jgi:hypothetical protein
MKEENIVIPRNMDEVFEFFDKELTIEEKEELMKYDAIEFHYSFGRWIRNNFGLWESSELKAWLINKDFISPDDMSNYIIEEYQKHLKSL